MSHYQSTKVIELGSCAFRQWRATHSHCSKLHGYQLKAKIWFGANELDEKNWIVDFGGLKDLKIALQHMFDHTLCVAADDPCLDLYTELQNRGAVDMRILANGVGIEKTAEYVFDIADTFIKTHTNNRCWVDKVEVFEHEDNSAVFTKSDIHTPFVITAEAVEPPSEGSDTYSLEATVETTVKRAANVGSNTSSGKGGWFQGTSWE